jgi:hypothetical protein
MSYYTFPKKNNKLNIFPNTCNNIKPFISHSLNDYLMKQIEECPNNEEVLKIINPYEFIFSKVPGNKFAVSKLRPPNVYFYILMEIIHTFNLLDSFSRRDITTMHFGNSSQSTIECLDMIREDKKDINIKNDLYSFTNIQINNINMIEFIYFELEQEKYLDLQYYFKEVILILLNILIYQSGGGSCVIKIDNIFYKPIIDFIFILTCLFDKVCVIKPNTSNILNSERFIVCKFFDNNNENQKYIHILKTFIDKNIKDKELLISGSDTNSSGTSSSDKIISSLIGQELPYYFLNKIEEANIIIGQHQLDAYDQAINIVKNKNKDEKLENIKKGNIQKCIQWCEKFKIPYNKFAEKVNIFLQTHNSEESPNVPNIFLYHPPVVVPETETETALESEIETVLESVLESEIEIETETLLESEVEISYKEEEIIIDL